MAEQTKGKRPRADPEMGENDGPDDVQSSESISWGPSIFRLGTDTNSQTTPVDFSPRTDQSRIRAKVIYVVRYLISTV